VSKLLWHSNAPHAPTGYGMQTALFAPRIAEHYDMAISSFWGVEGAPIVWEGIPVFPGMGGGTFGEEWLLAHAERFFGGDARDGLVVTLMDVWVLNPKIMAQMNSAAWVPVDHEPAPPRVVDFFAESGTVPIAMSKFGMQMLGRLDPLYVPHAVDSQKYQPKDRKTVRELTKLDEDTFVVGMVAANKGRPSRKAFTQAFQAFARFLEKHENSVLYLHTTLSRAHGDGEDLAELLEALEVPQENVRIADQYRMLFDPFGHNTMATIYSNLDVLLNPSMGEGFGVTMLEAQSCGVPVITTDATAMTEVVGAGWHVRPARGMGKGYWSGLKSWQQFPDVDDIHSALEECYALKPREREKLSAQARQHALGYDRDLVFDEYMLPALKAVEHRFANQQPVRIAPRNAVAA
jgi:glycosyltransferase involved in cell wall biosynthesis